jgi:predicted phosphodiesterase
MEKKRKWLIAALFAAVVLLGFAACPPAPDSDGGNTKPVLTPPGQTEGPEVRGNFLAAPDLFFAPGRKDGEISYSWTASALKAPGSGSLIRYRFIIVEGLETRAEDIIAKGTQVSLKTAPETGIFKGKKGSSYSAVVVAFTGSENRAVSPVRQAVAKNTAEYAAYDLRFGVISDCHIGYAGRFPEYPTADRLEKALKWYKEEGVDALVVAGDLVENGNTQAQWDTVKSLYTAGHNGSVRLISALGNHDSYALDNGALKAKERFEAATGQLVNAHYVIEGYHFIVLSGGSGTIYKAYRHTASGAVETAYTATTGSKKRHDEQTVTPAEAPVIFSDDVKTWALDQIAAAKADAPGKPVFVFFHWPIRNTIPTNTYGDSGHDTSSLGTSPADFLFKNQKEVVVFTGHLHVSNGNPRNIWQGGFTAVNVPSTNYFRVDTPYVSVKDDTFFLGEKTDGVSGSQYPKVATKAAGQGLVVSVKGSEVLIENFDFDMCEGPTSLESVVPIRQTWRFDVTKPQPYTNAARESQKRKPVFDTAAASNAAVPDMIRVTAKTATTVTVSFKQALIPEADNPGGDTVYGYRFEFRTNGAVAHTAWQWSDFMLTPRLQSPVYEQILGGLTANTAYELRIHALSALHSIDFPNGLSDQYLTATVRTE